MRLKIFGLGDSKPYARKVCDYLNEPLSNHEETYFDDGECYVRSEENVRGADVFVICSLYNSHKERLADKVMKLLYFAGSLRDASARRITLVFPYMAYQRQDRKNKSRAPIYTKYFPQLLEAIVRKNNRILTLDPHNLSAFQSGNRMLNDHLEAKILITSWLARNLLIDGIAATNVVAMSPDEGGVKRNRFCRDELSRLTGSEIMTAYVDKSHENDGTITANQVIGDIKGKRVIIFDDMISSAKTMCEGNEACKRAGGKLYAVCSTHALCVGSANEHVTQLLDDGVKVVVTDSVEPYRLTPEVLKRINVISTVPLIAEAIRCIHNEESLSRLLVSKL